MIHDVSAYLDARRELVALEHELATPAKDGTLVRINVGDLILEWDSFGPDFGSDDRALLQDYVHFLLVRDHLETFVEASSPATRAYLTELIRPTDDAFREATIPQDSGILGLFPRTSGKWWWRVTPVDLGRELQRQMSKAEAAPP